MFRTQQSFPFTDPFAPTRIPRARRVIVSEWERAVLFHNGGLVGVRGPGVIRVWTRGWVMRRVDVRPSVTFLPTQEVPTADGVPVKVTLTAQTRVVDPTAFVLATRDAPSAIYLAGQLAVREVVSTLTVEELLSARAELGLQLTGAIRGIEELGVAVERLAIRDIVLPSELKRAQAEVLVARAEGQAALERARGETAALRNLANAARLAAENPALVQLRLVQQLGAGGSTNTVVLSQPPA